ncbi:MAG: HD domain-containing protein [Geobacter sp.]|nr:HD domain-containing protein [Geobacter sp.]
MTPYAKEQLGMFINNLVQAAKAMTLYSPEHRMTAAHASRALENLNQILASQETLKIIRLGAELFVGGIPIEKSPLADRLNQQMSRYGIGHISIGRGADSADILLLMQIVANKVEQKLQPTLHLLFGTIDLDDTRIRPDDDSQAIPTYSAIPNELMSQLSDDFESCSSREHFDLRGVMALVAGFITSFRRESNPLLALVPLREMDEYTFTHSLDVCILNIAQGMSLGYEGQILHDIGIAAMLHDVGKQFVPKDVLNKPGELTEEDWQTMRMHTVNGANYLLNTPGMPRIAVMSAFEHHMKYDMSGYPKVPPGWQINLCSQITMVSDCFDALRTRRVYKDAMDFEKVAGIMLEVAGTGLNPALTLNFIKTLRKMGEQ